MLFIFPRLHGWDEAKEDEIQPRVHLIPHSRLLPLSLTLCGGGAFSVRTSDPKSSLHITSLSDVLKVCSVSPVCLYIARPDYCHWQKFQGTEYLGFCACAARGEGKPRRSGRFKAFFFSPLRICVITLSPVIL